MNLHCIALRTIKYSDRQSIVSAWSAELGRVGLLVPAGAGREARRLRALTMPLAAFEGVVDVRPGRDLYNIKDVRPIGAAMDLGADPAKAVVAMFLAEVLERVLRESPPDNLLSQFLFESVAALDAEIRPVGVANFPVYFLFKLGHFLGISPDESEWAEGRYFDMMDGRFRSSLPSHGRALLPGDARYVALLGRLTKETMSHIPVPRDVRRRILSLIIDYYTIHYTSLADLRSLAVVSEIF